MKSVFRPILRLRSATGIPLYFSTTPSVMAAGDTGSPKPQGFLAQKDAFQRREAAAEGLYIKQHEMEKIKALRKKLKEQRAHMDELDKHLEEIASNQGGEQN